MKKSKKLLVATLLLAVTMMVSVKVWALSPPYIGLDTSKDIITSKNAILNAHFYTVSVPKDEIKEFSLFLYQGGELVKSSTKVVENDTSDNKLYIQFNINKDLAFELMPNTEYSYTIAYTANANNDMYQTGFHFTTPAYDEPTTSEITTSETTVEMTTGNSDESVTTTQYTKSQKKKPAKVKLVIAKNIKKRSIGLRFKKVKNAGKYVVQYSLNKKLKKAISKKIRKSAYTIKKLELGKTYYIRIRAINKNYKGKWSDAKKIKVKK